MDKHFQPGGAAYISAAIAEATCFGSSKRWFFPSSLDQKYGDADA